MRIRTALSVATAEFEIILVNDGSRDESWGVIQALAQNHAEVVGIDLMRNYGQHNALLCGVRMARYGTIVTLDDDLQHPPEEIRFLLDELDRGHQVVYAVPSVSRHSWVRRLSSRCFRWFMSTVLRIPYVKHVSSFRAFDADIRRAFSQCESPHLMLDVLLSWGAQRYSTVTFRHERRRFARSNYTVRSLYLQSLVVLTSFTTAPLQFASIAGFAFAFVGIVVLAFVLTSYLFQGSIPGFPFLASLISIFSGVQLFALGVFGEYLARIFSRAQGRPPYVVAGTTSPTEVLANASGAGSGP